MPNEPQKCRSVLDTLRHNVRSMQPQPIDERFACLVQTHHVDVRAMFAELQHDAIERRHGAGVPEVRVTHVDDDVRPLVYIVEAVDELNRGANRGQV